MASFILSLLIINLVLVMAQTPICPIPQLYGASQIYENTPASNTVQYTICGLNASPMTCGSLPQDECASAIVPCCGVCLSQLVEGTEQGACLGTVFSSIARTTSGWQLTYSNGDPTDDGTSRQAIITLICGPSDMAATAFSQTPSDQPNGPITYTLTVQTRLLCNAVSGGTVFLLSVVLLFLGYFISGVIWNRLRYGRTGVEAVPHLALWKEIPLLAWDGMLFVKYKFATCFRKRDLDNIHYTL